MIRGRQKNYLKDFPAEQATNKNAKNANHLLIKCTSRQDSRCVNDKTHQQRQRANECEPKPKLGGFHCPGR